MPDFISWIDPPGYGPSRPSILLRAESGDAVRAGHVALAALLDQLHQTDVVTLAAGDSITFPCSRPHLIANRSATVTAIATWLIVNP
ncbi:MAG: hypothetical protein WAK82_25400 [Streptosporangiaceae bacterium]